MKIAFISPTYFSLDSIVGGAERYVDALGQAIASQGPEVTILSFGTQRESFRRGSASYEIFPGRHWRHFTQTNPCSLSHLSRIRRADVVHVHQLCTFVGDLAALFVNPRRRVLVGTDHGGGGAWVLNRRISVYPRFHAAIGQSRQAADLLRQRFSDDQIKLIPGGIDLGQFQPGTRHDPARGKSHFLFVGRLLPHKGVLTLVRAFRRIASTGTGLKILGSPMDPAFFSTLKQEAEGLPIEFITGGSDATVQSLYQEAVATIVPSQSHPDSLLPPELMGLTVLESQASGTPVIVSDSGPMRDFILEGETGMVFPAGDVASLAESMRQIAQWPRHGLETKCRNHVERFGWEIVAKEHINLYEALHHRLP